MNEKPSQAAIVGDPDLATASTRSTGTQNEKDLIHRFTEGAHQAVDRIADKAGPAVNKLESGVAHASDTLSQQARHMKEVGDEWTTSLRDTVRENPLTAITLAVTVGMVIAHMRR